MFGPTKLIEETLITLYLIADYFKSNIDLILQKIPVTYELLFGLTIIFFITFALIFFTKRKVEFIPLYLLTGILIGPIGLGLIKDFYLISLLGQIGIAFLLFAAGMEMSLKKLRDTSKDIVKIGILELTGIFAISLLLLKFIVNFTWTELIYISFIFSLSSTVVIVKIMSDKRELNTLHARILLGILILQDLFAILFLTFSKQPFGIGIFFTLLSFLLLLIITFFFRTFLLEKLLDFSSKNLETLLLFTLALLFFFSTFASLLGLSIIIGAFFAGLLIADSNYKVEIEGRIKPLRDFFALLFFVALGMQLKFTNFHLAPFLIGLLLMFLLKPILVYFLSEAFGYKKTTSFAVALPLANLSEFGLVIAVQGLYLTHLSQESFSYLILLTIIGMGISPYLIRHHYYFYKRFSNFLLLKIGKEKKLEYKGPQEEKILLVGCHRMGSIILEKLKKVKNKIFVIDHNPDIIKALIKKKITCIYGDATNTEVLEKVNWKAIEVLISTLPNPEINEFLIQFAKSKNKNLIAIVTAEKIHDALTLYRKQADYVILPQTLAGTFTSSLILEFLEQKNKKAIEKAIEKLKQSHITHMEKIHRLLY